MFNQYILILVWIGLMALIQKFFYRKEYNELTEEYDWKVSAFFSLIVILPLIIMAGLRGNFGDTYAYRDMYRKMPGTFSNIPEYISTVTKDKGFYFFSAIIHCIFENSYLSYFLIIAAIQGFLLARFYRRYSLDFLFSIFLFIASSDYYGWMFNGIRQFIAVVIILVAVPYMVSETRHVIIKKYLPIFIIILIAATMHQSALLMIPFVIIAQGEACNKKTILVILIAVIAINYVGEFTELMDDALQSTQYANVVSDYKEWNDDGTNPIRVLVYSIPAILAFWGRKQIRYEDNRLINLSVNMSIISMGLYLVSMVTSGIFIGRLPIYCSLFNYILLPWEIEHLFPRKIAALVRFAAIIGYLGFYYYFLHFQNGLI